MEKVNIFLSHKSNSEIISDKEAVCLHEINSIFKKNKYFEDSLEKRYIKDPGICQRDSGFIILINLYII